MNFLKKFINHKITIQDVLSSLEKFDNDVKSLNDFKTKANEYFGVNWKFNLEVYISSLSKDYKEKLYPLFKKILDYEKGLSIWTSAMQIVKGVKPLSSDVLKNMSEYKEYLSKFGIEGTRLYEKLSDLLDLNTPTEKIEEVQSVISSTTEEIASNPEKEEVVEEIEEVEEVEEVVKIPQQEEYTQKLKQRILQKMQDIEAKKKTSEISSSPVVKKEEKQEIIEEKLNSSEEQKKTKKIEKNNKIKEVISDTINSEDWILKNFAKVHNFLSNSREVMSAISLYKNAPSLEEYPFYGFIIDTIDYVIEQGEKILNDKSDAEILVYFPNGRSEIKEIIASYKEQKNNEIVISQDKIQAKQDIQKILNTNK